MGKGGPRQTRGARMTSAACDGIDSLRFSRHFRSLPLRQRNNGSDDPRTRAGPCRGGNETRPASRVRPSNYHLAAHQEATPVVRRSSVLAPAAGHRQKTSAGTCSNGASSAQMSKFERGKQYFEQYRKPGGPSTSLLSSSSTMQFEAGPPSEMRPNYSHLSKSLSSLHDSESNRPAHRGSAAHSLCQRQLARAHISSFEAAASSSGAPKPSYARLRGHDVASPAPPRHDRCFYEVEESEYDRGAPPRGAAREQWEEFREEQVPAYMRSKFATEQSREKNAASRAEQFREYSFTPEQLTRSINRNNDNSRGSGAGGSKARTSTTDAVEIQGPHTHYFGMNLDAEVDPTRTMNFYPEPRAPLLGHDQASAINASWGEGRRGPGAAAGSLRVPLPLPLKNKEVGAPPRPPNSNRNSKSTTATGDNTSYSSRVVDGGRKATSRNPANNGSHHHLVHEDLKADFSGLRNHIRVALDLARSKGEDTVCRAIGGILENLQHGIGRLQRQILIFYQEDDEDGSILEEAVSSTPYRTPTHNRGGRGVPFEALRRNMRNGQLMTPERFRVPPGTSPPVSSRSSTVVQAPQQGRGGRHAVPAAACATTNDEVEEIEVDAGDEDDPVANLKKTREEVDRMLRSFEVSEFEVHMEI